MGCEAGGGQGRLSILELNRIGLESGHFEEVERPWRRLGWCSGGQTEMGENPSNRGDDLQSTTTVGAVVYIDIEYAFEQPGPAQ